MESRHQRNDEIDLCGSQRNEFIRNTKKKQWVIHNGAYVLVPCQKDILFPRKEAQINLIS